MKKHLFYALLLIILAGLVSCKKDATQSETRYVVLSPEIAEIMAALDLTEQIVGLTEECTYPPTLAEIPRVGSFGAVKLENILALKPSLVFTTALEQDAIAYDLKRLGVPVESIYPKSVAEIFEGIERIGNLCEREEKATELIQKMKAELEVIKANTLGKSIPKV